MEKWFITLLTDCYVEKYDDDISILYYDKNYIREKKLCRVLGQEISTPKSGVMMFELDYKRKWLNCNKSIWDHISKEIHYPSIQDFIIRCLQKQDIKEFKPWCGLSNPTYKEGKV